MVMGCCDNCAVDFGLCLQKIIDPDVDQFCELCGELLRMIRLYDDDTMIFDGSHI